MTHLTEWILQCGQARQSRRRSDQKSRLTRALVFERYEERLALSTTVGEAVRAAMADTGEGGWIAVDVSSFHGTAIAGLVGATAQNADFSLYRDGLANTLVAAPTGATSFVFSAAEQFTFSTGVNVNVIDALSFDGDFTWHLVNRSWGPTGGMLTGAAVTRAVLDSGWALNHPDLPRLGGILVGDGLAEAVADFGANADLLGDVAGHSPRVLPIPPPAPGADDPSGGRIAMTAFTGVTGLALARPEELGLLAKGRQPVRDAMVEERLPPAHAEPVETLRGRAIIYEVAQLDRAAAADREGEGSPFGFAERSRADWWTVAHAARDAAAATGADVGTTSDQAPRRGFHAVAARYAELALNTVNRSDHAAVIEDFAVRSGGISAQSALGAAAERDAAFARLAEDSAASDLEAPPVAATAGARERTAFGLALLLAIGAGPVSKFVRSRRKAAATEQRPPQRRAAVLQPVS